MIPVTIYTVIIGNEVPDIVNKCQINNMALCEKWNIEYEIIHAKRVKAIRCPGLQAEFIKKNVIKAFCNQMVIDWDIELLEKPDIPVSNKIYCGKYTNGKPDSNILLCNSSEAKNNFSKIDTYTGFKKQITGFLFGFLNKEVDTVFYPDNYYKHHNTNLGMNNIGGTYGDLSDYRKSKVNSRCN
jgi:hypothetical protein